MGGGYGGAIPTLDQVLAISGDQTTHSIKIIRTNNGEDYLIFSDGVTDQLKFQNSSDGVDITDMICSQPLQIKLGEGAVDSSLSIMDKAGTTLLKITPSIIVPYVDTIPFSAVDLGSDANPFGKFITNDLIRFWAGAEKAEISRSADYLILDAGVGAIGVLIEDGYLGFVGANKCRMIDDGASFKILYGAGPDSGIGLGCCSGGTYYIDINDDANGRIDTQFETLVMNDGGFDPTRNFVEILGINRTSGHVLTVVGDQPTLTTGDILRVYNDGIGAGTDFVFGIDKNGVITIGDPTGAEHGKIERTIDDFIFDTGAGGGLSIRIANTEVIGDNGVSALVLGNVNMAPQLFVYTTAERNALTATQGMIIWHTGPPSRAETYTGVGWVAL